ncbi:histidine kinase [Pedobacter gandavensis]|uniref:sensor histidine kinase n=1 Tax=Pedobacter gandavensis TaxID=2679963 RepID=UPI00247AACEE|nr:histidine kinase [Pedobacter gandavensis]WGQ10427.1 histidine kinase [Pedobacter gandavensis]
MKKNFLLSLICLIIGFMCRPSAFAQKGNPPFGNQIYFNNYATDVNSKMRTPSTISAADTAVYQAFTMLSPDPLSPSENRVPKSPIMLGVKLSPSLTNFFPVDVKSISKSYSSYLISDGSEAILIAVGINKENVGDYRYRVVENDSVELVPWSKIPALAQNYGAKQPYGFIGKFQSPGKQVFVEVVNILNYGIRDGVIFDWRKSFKPVLLQMGVLQSESKNTPTAYYNLLARIPNAGLASKYDPITNIPLNFAFPVDRISNMTLYFKNHETVMYSIFLISKVKGRPDTTRLREVFRDDVFELDSKYYQNPGKYEILIQRAGDIGWWPESQILRIPFEVKPAPLIDSKVSIKQILPYFLAALSGVALLFLLYYRRHKNRLARAARDQQVMGLKLRSIRAQLNPHFMFNALSSIQNLINKNNIPEANYYLSKFAGLTRQVLDSDKEELISLEDELQLMSDYLQMEQLRFNFQYEIQVDERINQANVEIPAMLLQPFIENAVKHGIAGLKGEGRILMTVSLKENDLVFTITDNGKGFDVQKKASGYGLKLTEEYVALLCQIYKEQPTTLHIDSNEKGTTIRIQLSNWNP